jgi:hypothetical protein
MVDEAKNRSPVFLNERRFMISVLPPVTHLRFDIREHGWSILEFGSANIPIVIPASHVFSDPCEELMRFCERVLLRDFGATVRFWEEPDYSILQFGEKAYIPFIRAMREEARAGQRAETSEIARFSSSPVYFVALCIGEFKRLAFLCDRPEHTKNRSRFPLEAYRSLMKRWEDRGNRL